MDQEYKTVYMQGDDAQHFLSEGVCDRCFRLAEDWADEDNYGGVEIHGEYDHQNDLVGLLCPTCASKYGKEDVDYG